MKFQARLLIVFVVIGMVRIAVDRVQNVAMLRSSTLDSYLTGHIDNGIVDGKVRYYYIDIYGRINISQVHHLHTYSAHYKKQILTFTSSHTSGIFISNTIYRSIALILILW